MPTAAPTRCHCGARATHQGRCEAHQRKPWETPSRNTRTLTLTRHQRATIRADQLAREPHCRHCGAEDNLEVDHIIEIADGGAHDDPGNLATLCRDCHSAKTAEARAARRRRNAAQL